MSKHTLQARGKTYEWDDNDPQPWSKQRNLLDLHQLNQGEKNEC